MLDSYRGRLYLLFHLLGKLSCWVSKHAFCFCLAVKYLFEVLHHLEKIWINSIYTYFNHYVSCICQVKWQVLVASYFGQAYVIFRLKLVQCKPLFHYRNPHTPVTSQNILHPLVGCVLVCLHSFFGRWNNDGTSPFLHGRELSHCVNKQLPLSCHSVGHTAVQLDIQPIIHPDLCPHQF